MVPPPRTAASATEMHHLVANRNEARWAADFDAAERTRHGGYLIRPFAVRHLIGAVVQSGTFRREVPSGGACELTLRDCRPRTIAAREGAVRVRHVGSAVLDRLRYVTDRDLPVCGIADDGRRPWKEEVWRAPGATPGDTLSTRYRVIEITGGNGFGAHGDGANGFGELMEEVTWKLTLGRR